MSHNQKDESRQHAQHDRPLTKPNETERDPMNPVPGQPRDAEPEPTERPDLDWNEHED